MSVMTGLRQVKAAYRSCLALSSHSHLVSPRENMQGFPPGATFSHASPFPLSQSPSLLLLSFTSSPECIFSCFPYVLGFISLSLKSASYVFLPSSKALAIFKYLAYLCSCSRKRPTSSGRGVIVSNSSDIFLVVFRSRVTFRDSAGYSVWLELCKRLEVFVEVKT